MVLAASARFRARGTSRAAKDTDIRVRRRPTDCAFFAAVCVRERKRDALALLFGSEVAHRSDIPQRKHTDSSVCMHYCS
jgi:hypothetical protein